MNKSLMSEWINEGWRERRGFGYDLAKYVSLMDSVREYLTQGVETESGRNSTLMVTQESLITFIQSVDLTVI